MDALRLAWIAAGAFLLSGCTDEPVAVPQLPSGPPKSVWSVPPQAAAEAPRAETAPLASETDPVALELPAPGSLSDLRAARAEPEDLQRWLKEGRTAPELQVVMLQDLQQQSEADAIEIAIELAEAKTSDRLVRANAVALLARSQDPRAAAALAALPEKYQRMAKALRKTQ